MPFINFHTHHEEPSSGIVTVCNLELQDINPPMDDGFYTAGIHPWKANDENIEDRMAKLVGLLSHPKLIGIGEIGLDKVNGPGIDIQEKVFTQQLAIASQFNKPVIIHCVKAWDELIAAKKDHGLTLNWAIHGFNGSAELAKQLVNKNFYLSIGESILNEKSKVGSALSEIPLDRLFIETDASTQSLETLYRAVAQKLEASVDLLSHQIAKNFKEFFNVSPGF